MTSVQIGVSGLGSIGCRHARLLAEMPGVEVHGFDSHGVSDAAAAELGGLTSIAPSLDALIERAPTGLIVATPDAVHVEQAELAVRAGVPVLIEKPLSNDLVSAQAITDLAAAQGVAAMVGYVLRHHGTMRRLQQVVAGGDIGAPASVHATLSAYETLVVARNRFDDDATYRLVFDYSHEWDYLQWLFGPIVRCAATSRVAPGVQPSQTPNVVDALFDFETDLTGSVHLDYVSPGVRRCRVIGEEGVVEMDIASGSIGVKPHGGDELLEIVREERDVAFVRQLEHFIEIAQGRAEPIVSLRDGVNAIAVADALVVACTERRWVDVSPVPGRREVDPQVPPTRRSE